MATLPFNPDDHLISLKRIVIKKAHRQKSSAGDTMSFPAGTTKKRRYRVTFGYFTYAESLVFEDFIDQNQGIDFDVPDPDPNSDLVYSLIFDQDEFEFDYIRAFHEDGTKGWYQIELNMVEP